MQVRSAGLEYHRDVISRFTVRIEDSDSPVLSVPAEGTKEAAIRQGGHIAGINPEVGQVSRGNAGSANGDAAAGYEGQSSVRHGRGTSAIESAQASAILRGVLKAEFSEAVGAIRIDGGKQGFHLATIEEVIGPDENEPTIGHDPGFIVEDKGVGQGLDVAPVGSHGEEGAGRGIVVFLESADPGGSEDDPSIRQF